MLQQHLVTARRAELLTVQMWLRQSPLGKELKYLIWRNKGINQHWALVPDSCFQVVNALLAKLPVPVLIPEKSLLVVADFSGGGSTKGRWLCGQGEKRRDAQT